MFQKAGYSQSSTHPQPTDHDSRQTIQARPKHSNRLLPQSRGLQSNMLRVVPTQSGPVCHQIQQQASIICLTGSGPPGMGSGCTQPVMGGFGHIRLPTSSYLGQTGEEPVQQNCNDCTRVAQHALGLESSGNV